LIEAFSWDETPEGHDFWYDISKGGTPEIPAPSLEEMDYKKKQLRSANRELAQIRVDGFKEKQEKMLKDLSAKELEDDVNRNKI